MLKSLYNRLIGEKLFNKILATYTAIIILVLILLAFTVLQNISSSKTDSAINNCAQIVQEINNYYLQKIEYSKQIQQAPYLHKDSYGDMIRWLNSNVDEQSPDYISQIRFMEKFSSYCLDIDNDISEIFILKTKDNTLYSYTRSKLALSIKNSVDDRSLLKYSGRTSLNPLILSPTGLFADKTDNYRICTTFNMRTTDSWKVNGTLFIYFNTYKMYAGLLEKYKNFASEIRVFTKDGTVLYDSAGIYDGNQYPGFMEILNSKSGLLRSNTSITSINSSDKTGIIATCTVRTNQIDKSLNPTKRVIFLSMVACILLALMLSYIFMSLFSKRTKAVCSAMNSAKAGDLSQRVKIYNSNDEINQIALDFNSMCDNLNDYINRVYISGLKQKDAEIRQKIAELYALQSEINPHFLMNTLEAIRMQAVNSGNHDVGKMIRILGQIFRNSINREMFVSIRNEIEYLKSYLELFALRYGDSLRISYEIEDTVYKFGIIKHILQPLVENSLVHGIDADKSVTFINIKFHLSEEDVEITIVDNGIGISEEDLQKINKRLDSPEITEEGKVGIVNVTQRIRLIFGVKYGVYIKSKVGEGTSILVRIPAKTMEELERYVQSYAG